MRVVKDWQFDDSTGILLGAYVVRGKHGDDERETLKCYVQTPYSIIEIPGRYPADYPVEPWQKEQQGDRCLKDIIVSFCRGKIEDEKREKYVGWEETVQYLELTLAEMKEGELFT
jgi:hypothetical protein